MFKSLTNLPKPHEFAEGGFEKEIQKYEELINKKTGKLELVPTEKDNFYNRIQEQVEDQLLDTIIKRYKININDKHITQLNNEVVDMTQYPEDLLSAYALAHQMEKQFQESPADVKNYFKDFAGYLKSFQNGTLREDLEKLSYLNKNLKMPSKNIEDHVITQPQQTIQPQTTQENTYYNGGNA